MEGGNINIPKHPKFGHNSGSKQVVYYNWEDILHWNSVIINTGEKTMNLWHVLIKGREMRKRHM